MDHETQIAIILERLENLKYQQGRLVSHFESEQRVSVSQGKRIDDALRRVEQLEKENEKRDRNKLSQVTIWIAIAGLIISVIGIFLKT